METENAQQYVLLTGFDIWLKDYKHGEQHANGLKSASSDTIKQKKFRTEIAKHTGDLRLSESKTDRLNGWCLGIAREFNRCHVYANAIAI